MSNTTRLPYKKHKVARLPQRQQLNFRRVHFLCDFCPFSGGHKTAARHLQITQCCRKAVPRLLQDTQGVRTTDVIVHHPLICLTKAAKVPQVNRAIYRKAAARMTRNVRLQLKNDCTAAMREPHDVSLCLATVVQILHDHLVAALHVT